MRNIKFLSLVVLSLVLLSAGYMEQISGYCPSTEEGGGGQIRPDPNPIPNPLLTGSSRPSPSTGLEPLIFNPPFRFGPLLDWEIWWIRNRLNYLPFKEPINWEEKSIDPSSATIALPLAQHKALLEALNDALKNDKSPNVKAMAALALGKFKDKNAVPYLKETLKNEKDYDARNVTSLALGILGDPSVVPELKEIVFNNSAREVSRCYAMLALGYIQDESARQVIKEALDPAKGLKKEIVCSSLIALSISQDQKFVALAGKILNDEQWDEAERAYAALALGRLKSDDGLPFLKQALSVKDANIRASVAVALGSFSSPEIKDILMKLVKEDRDNRVRQFALISLARLPKVPSDAGNGGPGKSPDKSVYDIFTQLITSKKDPIGVQSFAVLSLGLLGEERATNTLREFVVKKNINLRTASIIALGLLKDKKSVPVLISILEKEEKLDAVSFLYAIQSLGMIGDTAAVPILEKIYKRAQEDITLASSVYNNTTVSLTMLGKRKEVIDILHNNLKNKSLNQQIMLRTLHGLAYVGDKSSIEPLLAFYKDEKNPDVRTYVMFALGFILDKERINPLYKITADLNYYLQLVILDHIAVSKPD